MAQEWCTIESDPGVFTELLAQIGVKGLQVEELYDLTPDTFARVAPVYGLIFLFKWQRDLADSRAPTVEAPQVFFARQVISNACATQAIINILLNRDDVEIGPELRKYREFALALPPDVRGQVLGNLESLRQAHNSFARPEPFISDEKAPATDDDEVYHFVGYVPVQGVLYELDGLKSGPVALGACTKDDWLGKAAPAIQERIRRYSEKEIRFNLLALVQNRREALEKTVRTLKARQERVAAKLANPAAAASAMDTTGDDFALPDTAAELTALQQQLAAELKEAQLELRAEEEKHANWRQENIRRKHNYVPFVFNLLSVLARKGKLRELVDQAKKATEEREARVRKQRAEERAKQQAAPQQQGQQPPAK